MKTDVKIAVIQYPGTNCEYETAAAVNSAGMKGEVFRWNRDPAELDQFNGYVIPGGFSYQDRVRAGAVAAKKSISDALIHAGESGKPILGICNGAQILIETGMVPGISWGTVEMALAANNRMNTRGYICDWVYIRNVTRLSNPCFNKHFIKDEIIPIPVAHAEGRFTTANHELLENLSNNGQIGFKYCSIDGDFSGNFPVNPNGSLLNIAGLYNPQGNVLALMPHPERAAWLRQIPLDIDPSFSKKRLAGQGSFKTLAYPGPGLSFFTSMKQYIEEQSHE